MSRSARRKLQTLPAATEPAPSSAHTAAAAISTTPALSAAPYSCLACKQRKVRCDRQFPCAECIRMGVDCVAVSRKPYAPRKRRRAPEDTGSPERPQSQPPCALSVTNSPRHQLRKEDTDFRDARPIRRSRAMVFGQYVSPDLTRFYLSLTTARNLWTGLREDFCEAQPGITPATEEQPSTNLGSEASPSFDSPFDFILGKSTAGPKLTDLQNDYPQPVHAFMLWQTYLLSVNPLSKVIWAPKVQDLVIQAAGDYEGVSAADLALLFSIFAAAVSSLSENDCQAKLVKSKQSLLAKYLACAKQALAAADFMRSTNIEVLQAFTIFLLAARQSYDANTMWILTGMAIRMGQRLLAAVPSQAANTTAKCSENDCMIQKSNNGKFTEGSSFFQMQMILRVWWQIVLIDGRVTQLAGQTRNFYGDTSDHPLPASLNDSDLSPQMTSIPQAISERPTEMVFCLLRYEMGKLIMSRSSVLHDSASSMAERDAVIDEIATYLDEKYLIHLDSAIPLHQIAEAGAKAAILKMRLMAHHPGQYPDEGKSLPQTEHYMLFQTSLEMVNILVRGFTTMNIDPFRWHTDVYFQLDAVVFMLIESQTQAPFDEKIDKAWSLVASVLYHKPHLVREQDELGRAVRQLILRAWDTRERRARQLSPGKSPPTPPALVANVLSELRQQKRVQQQDQGKAEVVVARFHDREAELGKKNQNDTQGGAGDKPVVPASDDSALALPSEAHAMNALSAELLPSLGLEYSATSPSGLCASSFHDMEIPGWDASDWDSWSYWNTLLQSQPE